MAENQGEDGAHERSQWPSLCTAGMNPILHSAQAPNRAAPSFSHFINYSHSCQPEPPPPHLYTYRQCLATQRGEVCPDAVAHSVPACLGCLMPQCHSCSEGAPRQGPIVQWELAEGWGRVECVCEYFAELGKAPPPPPPRSSKLCVPGAQWGPPECLPRHDSWREDGRGGQGRLWGRSKARHLVKSRLLTRGQHGGGIGKLHPGIGQGSAQLFDPASWVSPTTPRSAYWPESPPLTGLAATLLTLGSDQQGSS